MTVPWPTIALGVLLCLGPTSVTAAAKLVVYKVNFHLQYFAQRIGGEHVDVHFPAPPDVDPAFWRPDMATVRRYQQADLILLNGAGYAEWLHKVSRPRLRQVNTARGFRDQHIKLSARATHSHGPGGEHSHTGTVFATWLDPLLALQQAEAIRDALSKQRPALEHAFTENYAVLERELRPMDQTTREIVAKQHRLSEIRYSLFVD